MPLPSFRLRTLMIAVAVLGCWFWAFKTLAVAAFLLFAMLTLLALNDLWVRGVRTPMDLTWGLTDRAFTPLLLMWISGVVAGILYGVLAHSLK
jgi:hypothetical protein